MPTNEKNEPEDEEEAPRYDVPEEEWTEDVLEDAREVLERDYEAS